MPRYPTRHHSPPLASLKLNLDDALMLVLSSFYRVQRVSMLVHGTAAMLPLVVGYTRVTVSPLHLARIFTKFLGDASIIGSKVELKIEKF